MFSFDFQSKLFNITVVLGYAPTRNAKVAGTHFFQSAGKGDKELAMGIRGLGVGEGRPIHTVQGG